MNTSAPSAAHALAKPRHCAPSLACDAHMHIFDPAFAHEGAEASIAAGATADDYRLQQERIGTTRTVVVTPRPYGTDNRITLNAIARLGAADTRGVAVLHPDVSDATLGMLHAGGIRGIRFSLYTPEHAATRFDMVEPLARRVHELGWHVQLHWTAQQIVEHETMLARLPGAVVFDHMARLPLPQGTSHPAFDIVRRRIEQGNTWVKLSGAYLDSLTGEAGRFQDSDAVAREWVRVAPERLVWGSDWPHITESRKPDDALLFDMLSRWVDDETTRHGILVTNAERLYGFASS